MRYAWMSGLMIWLGTQPLGATEPLVSLGAPRPAPTIRAQSDDPLVTISAPRASSNRQTVWPAAWDDAGPPVPQFIPGGLPDQPSNDWPPPSPANDPLRPGGRRPEPPMPNESESKSFWGSWWPIGGERPPSCETCAPRAWFASDNRFDAFVSPITNPFLAEDPRALTEVRPLFFYQSIPNSTPFFQGGSASYFGVQARLALNNWFSFTLNKLGGVWINPGDGSFLSNGSGFSEIWLGPKFSYGFTNSSTVLGGGVLFQIPTGSSNVFQNTGNVSVTPYFSIAQAWPIASLGRFNFIDTFGYSFGSGGRSEYFYNSFHVDYPVYGRFFPMLELNWFHYTQAGNSRPLTVEGADLANVGAFGVAGRDYLNIATGGRVKIWEGGQIGAAVEFPLIKPKDLFDFRFTIDFIFKF